MELHCVVWTLAVLGGSAAIGPHRIEHLIVYAASVAFMAEFTRDMMADLQRYLLKSHKQRKARNARKAGKRNR